MIVQANGQLHPHRQQVGVELLIGDPKGQP